jgi:flagellar P-ring protein FlgI
MLRHLLLTTLLTAAAAAQAPLPNLGPANAGPSATAPATNPPPSVVIPPATRPSPADPTATIAPTLQPTPLGEMVLTPRIRSITRLHNSMPHQLIGIGLVTGLANTGSSDRGTRQAIINVVRQLGLNLNITDVVGGTTALVSLTCSLPPFAKAGQALDVKVEVLSDTVSLRGGELLRAELKGVDGQTYVVAQGALIVAGYTAAGQNASVQKNTNTTAWLHNGGLVVREENTSFFSESGALELQLLNPSPFNAASVAAGVRTALDGSSLAVSAVDPTLVRIQIPETDRTAENALRILNLVGNVRVEVENPAKVMIDQASGTVLAGEGVMISPCVVGLSDLTIAIVDEDYVSQPNAFGAGDTERVGRSRVEVQTNSTDLKRLGGGATVSDLLQNLKALGLTPAQLVSVFQTLDQGGFLHASLEVR